MQERAKFTAEHSITKVVICFADGHVEEFVEQDAPTIAFKFSDKPQSMSVAQLVGLDIKRRGGKLLHMVPEQALAKAAHFGEQLVQFSMSVSDFADPETISPKVAKQVPINAMIEYVVIIKRASDA